ncbi:MAG: glycosyltransferase family 4 protein [Candidatus Promineifilaceae bacterium]
MIRPRPSVLFFIRHFYPAVGGAERQLLLLAGELRRQGCEVTIATGRYADAARVETMDGVVVHRLFVGPYAPVLHELAFLLSAALFLFGRRADFDTVVTFQTQLVSVAAALVTRLTGQAFITRVASAGEGTDLGQLRRLPAGRLLVAVVRNGCDAAVAVSEAVRQGLLAAGFPAGKAHVIPNGVRTVGQYRDGAVEARMRLGFRRDELLVVFVGRLAAPKGLELLLQAWSLFAADWPNGRLLLVGDGPLRSALQEQVLYLSIDSSVTFSGMVDDVDEYLRAADIFVLSSHYEGLSNSLLEAMAAGLPVISTRVSGSEDVIQHGRNGLLIEPGDPDGLRRALNRLASSPELRSSLGRAASHSILSHHRLDRVAAAYQLLISRLAASGQHRVVEA